MGTNLWGRPSLGNVSQEGASAELVSFFPWSDWDDNFRNYLGEDFCHPPSFRSQPWLAGFITVRQAWRQCLDAWHLLRCHSRVPAGSPQLVTGTTSNFRRNWVFKSDFDKTLAQLQGLMRFPFWCSPKLPDSEKSERISGFEKQRLLTNTSISFSTQISSQRKCTIPSLSV